MSSDRSRVEGGGFPEADTTRGFPEMSVIGGPFMLDVDRVSEDIKRRKHQKNQEAGNSDDRNKS